MRQGLGKKRRENQRKLTVGKVDGVVVSAILVLKRGLLCIGFNRDEASGNGVEEKRSEKNCRQLPTMLFNQRRVGEKRKKDQANDSSSFLESRLRDGCGYMRHTPFVS